MRVRRARQTAFQSLNTGVCGNCGEEVTFDLHDRDVCSPLRTFTRGDKVWWRRVASGGYGFAERVPAVVIRTTDKRVVIDAELQTGGYKRVAVRWRNVEARS